MMGDNRMREAEKEEPHDTEHEQLIRTIATSATAGVVVPIFANRAELLERFSDYLFLIVFSLLSRQLGLWFAHRTITPETRLLSFRTFFYGLLTLLLSASGGLLYLILKLW